MERSNASSRLARLPWRPSATVSLATLGVILLTIGVYLARAGAAPSDNWPSSLNLLSSDNGILFEVSRDIVRGVTLDWSFSPQVYVFPEIPISLIAYLLSGGAIDWYFIAVAAIDMALIFLVFVGLAAALWRERIGRSVARALIATMPLLLMPLVAEQKTYLFQLFPTYYYGMMLFGLALPLAILSPRRWVRLGVLAAWALTGAANPLLFAMSLPGVALSAIAVLARPDRRSSGLVPALAWTLGSLLVAVLVRLVFFNPIAGTDPASYISLERAEQRMREISGTFRDGFTLSFDPWLLGLSWVAIGACVLLAGWTGWRLARKPSLAPEERNDLVARFYLATLPVLGVVAMAAILALHVYYLWFALVGSIAIAALLLPPRRFVRPVAIALVLLTAIGATWGISNGLYSNGRYFGFRSAVTACLDAVVPGQTGYSTFSDARPLSLPSRTGVTLIAINDDLSPNFWLTNRSYSKERLGTFVLVNPDTVQAPIAPATIRAAWGMPERRFQCGPAEVWTYPSEDQQQRLATWFDAYRDLR
ncbi:MAG TPA: hypothetical protein VK139_00345 [Microbacteriaceae bacterium]|nr:hypothetical protein [Microbacteriaceae bacterium]